jgi:hypothetical protein
MTPREKEQIELKREAVLRLTREGGRKYPAGSTERKINNAIIRRIKESDKYMLHEFNFWFIEEEFMNLDVKEIELVTEALALAASRHESQGHVTKGSFRYEHDETARKMRELRIRLLQRKK